MSDSIFSKIYPFSTENILGYINEFNLNKKSLLTVGSSCDQIINAIFCGSNKITLIDICFNAKYYYYLKKASILSLNYDEFFEFLIGSNVFQKKHFLRVLIVLKEINYESYIFWKDLFLYEDEYEISNRLFFARSSIKSIIDKSNLYLFNNNNYKITKDAIFDINPEFICHDIYTYVPNQSYDNIFLSNLSSYSSLIEHKKLVDKFFNCLNKNGRMLMAYLYYKNNDTMYSSSIYDNEKRDEIFCEYNIQLISFIGLDGIYNDIPIRKDSALILKK